MLPKGLHGPGRCIFSVSPDAFLVDNASRFPRLDPDFILQLCFEHPDRFEELFPHFDPKVHDALRIPRTAGWVYDYVRYDQGEVPDFWSEQFDSFLERGERDYGVFTHMIGNGTWPFPPVIVKADLAIRLGATVNRVGPSYYLVEGTHRVSYLRRMVELGIVLRQQPVDIIEILESH